MDERYRQRVAPVGRGILVMVLMGSLMAGAGSPLSAAPDVQAGHAAVNGLRMYYELHGPEPAGAGRPLLLLHGGGSSIRTTFGAVLPALARTRRVIAIEQQGHGRTADIDRPLSFEQMADDGAALLGSLGVAEADVFGFSVGGNVALQMAIRHPERVGRLVVGSTFYRTEALAPAVRASFAGPVTPADMPAPLREEYLRIAPHPEHLQRQIDKLMAMLGGFRDWPPQMLQAIRAPTLVLLGNADIVGPEHAMEMCRLIADCTLAILPGGHGTYLGEVTAARPGSRLPEITVLLVEEFLGR